MKDREFLTVDLEKMRARMKVQYPIIVSRYEKAISMTSGG